MKKLMVCLCIVFFASGGVAIAQDDFVSAFSLQSQDDEVESIDEVIVKETRIMEIEWKASEFDFYIQMKNAELSAYKERIKGLEEELEDLKDMKNKVLNEAIKCKLKPKTAEES